MKAIKFGALKQSVAVATIAAMFMAGCSTERHTIDLNDNPKPAESVMEEMEASASGKADVEAVSTEGATLPEQLQEAIRQATSAADILAFIEERSAEADEALADAMLRELHAYYDRNLEETRRQFFDQQIYNDLTDIYYEWPMEEEDIARIEDESARRFVRQLSEDGYKLGIGGGIDQPLVDYSRQQTFGERLSSGMKHWIDLLAFESEEAVASDGGLRISWDQLAERTLFAEAFLRQYPQYPEYDDARRIFDKYLNMYLGNSNMPNSPIYDAKSRKLLPEVRASYERAMEQSPDSATARFAAGLLDVLAATGHQVATRAPDNVIYPVPAVQRFYETIPSEMDRLLAPPEIAPQ